MEKILGLMSAGRWARVSNWKMTEEQVIYLNAALNELYDVLDKIFPGWKTLNLEVSKEEEE